MDWLGARSDPQSPLSNRPPIVGDWTHALINVSFVFSVVVLIVMYALGPERYGEWFSLFGLLAIFLGYYVVWGNEPRTSPGYRGSLREYLEAIKTYCPVCGVDFCPTNLREHVKKTHPALYGRVLYSTAATGVLTAVLLTILCLGVLEPLMQFFDDPFISLLVWVFIACIYATHAARLWYQHELAAMRRDWVRGEPHVLPEKGGPPGTDERGTGAPRQLPRGLANALSLQDGEEVTALWRCVLSTESRSARKKHVLIKVAILPLTGRVHYDSYDGLLVLSNRRLIFVSAGPLPWRYGWGSAMPLERVSKVAHDAELSVSAESLGWSWHLRRLRTVEPYYGTPLADADGAEVARQLQYATMDMADELGKGRKTLGARIASLGA